MPSRQVPLVNEQIYHVFNRGVACAPIFSSKKTYQRFLLCVDYYRFLELPVKLSYLLSMSKDKREEILTDLKKKNKILVQIYGYCLMSNHFHLLIKQSYENGISQFMRKASNSYSSYYNLLHERQGSLFQGVFKAVRIETDEQLLHVSRYVHINSYVGHLTSREGLFSYPWSSLPFYLNKAENNFVSKNPMVANFSSEEEYRHFLLDEADYLRSKKQLAHLFLD